jgi:hypothetical protein
MLNLAEYRHRPAGLADFLPWAALVDEGVVLNKDGSFQRTARFRGPDLDSATPAELVGVTARLNNALRRLGSGWAIFVEAQRIAAQTYPHSTFPDPASALVDLERQDAFEEAGAHFESRYFLTFVWLPPAEDTSRVEGWLYEGRSQTGVDPWKLLHGFVDRTNRVLQLVEGFMPEVAWLDDGDTLTYLHSTISTRQQRVRVPETPMHLDALLADEPLAGGLEPRLGAHHLRTLTVVGFPTATHPGILDELNRLAFPYRWSTRAILLDKTEAVKLRISQSVAACQCDGAFEKFVVNVGIDIDALDRAAGLPTVEEGAIHKVFDGESKVGILADIGWIFATKLQPETHKARCGGLLDFVPGADGAGEGDMADAGIPHQFLGVDIRQMKHLQDPFRQAGGGEGFENPFGAELGLRGVFKYHGIACHDGRDDRVDRGKIRVIPGRYDIYDAERNAPDKAVETSEGGWSDVDEAVCRSGDHGACTLRTPTDFAWGLRYRPADLPTEFLC